MKNSRKSRQYDSESESFELEAHQMKKLGLERNRKRIAQGSWSVDQNKIYLQFLLENVEEFETELLRRKNRVFYRISKLLRRRTPDQCRSHHQKLLNKHKGNIFSVIRQLQSRTCGEIDVLTKLRDDKKMQMTSLCTVEFGNEGQKKDQGEKEVVREQFEGYGVEFGEDFIQLYIDVENIKEW